MCLKKMYYTHCNWKRPFKVEVVDNKVDVYKCVGFDMNTNEFIYSTKKRTFHPRHIFVGKHFNSNDPETIGNSLLLHMKNLEYIYIGDSVRSFRAFSPIVTYDSEIGNNDVPYPFAIDDKNNFYLMIEKVVLTKCLDESPYDWYYAHNKICKIDNEPCEFFINQNKYDFRYVANPRKDYLHCQDVGIDDMFDDHDINDETKKKLMKTVKLSVKVNGKECILTARDYKKIVEEFGAQKGFVKLPMRIIHRRLNIFEQHY